MSQSATSPTAATTARPVTAVGKYYKGLWSLLDSGRLYTQRELDDTILRVTNDYPGHLHNASVHRNNLVAHGALVVTRGDDGKPRYQRAERFPEIPDYSPGSPAMRAYERQRYEEELAAAAREREQMYAHSPHGLERRMWEKFIADQLAPLRAEVEQLREQLQQSNAAAPFAADTHNDPGSDRTEARHDAGRKE
jgi:hypothetical protein